MPRPAAITPELLKHLLKKPATVFYPFEKLPVPERYRGRHIYHVNRCNGCSLCARDCPTGAITMVPDIRPEGQRTKTGKRPRIFLAACMFCGQCVLSCPNNAIEMTGDYELAAYSKDEMNWKEVED
ncbi:MAG: NADH-quinone oxidoreductase subunit I [Candidatus Freyarchaeota archaeon]|nr:NADH-quinone oxidoreductase subunit I [Candidatus Jordarchaeia archaeon]